jgi:hypothetical protein
MKLPRDYWMESVEDRKDIAMIEMLKRAALKEDPALGFRSFDPQTQNARLLWYRKPDGVSIVIGYYSYTDQSYGGVPIMRQIFLIEGQRGEGLGGGMWEDFQSIFPDQKLGIESPNIHSLAMLSRIGLAEYSREKECWMPRNGLRFVSGG